MKITGDMVHSAYKIAKMVYTGDIGRRDGMYKIAQESGMSYGSAENYIWAYLCMMDGKKYTRTINADATRYYLENICKDFGERQFKIALKAVKAHIQYYNSLGYGKLNKIQGIVNNLSE